MRRYLGLYELRYSPYFKKKIKKMDKKARKRIENAILDLRENPYHNTEFLKGQWKGKRKLRVGDYRVVFIICEECQRLNHKTYNRCKDCGSIPPNTIIIVDLIRRHKY